MANYNKVILVGNLTRDPQLSYLPSQTPVVDFGLATNRKWRSQDGQQREEVCFIDCRAFAKSAETINQYVRKGQQILVEGRLTFDQWQDQSGQKRSKHRITVETFQFLGAPSGQGQGQGNASRPAPAPRQAAPSPSGGAPEGDMEPSYDGGEPEPPTGENIPF